MSLCVLDTSAVLAWLAQEPGWEVVDAALTSRDCRISAVNWAEFLTKLHERIDDSQIIAGLASAIPIQKMSFDDTQADRVARLRRMTRAVGLSLGDRACLALAQQLDAEALTADRAWSGLELGIHIHNIRPRL